MQFFQNRFNFAPVGEDRKGNGTHFRKKQRKGTEGDRQNNSLLAQGYRDLLEVLQIEQDDGKYS